MAESEYRELGLPYDQRVLVAQSVASSICCILHSPYRYLTVARELPASRGIGLSGG
jgi:hypothetical protein